MSESAGEKPVHEACGGCGTLMDVAGFGPFDAVICPGCSAETRVKRHFGTYRLERRYAIGGMSVIFAGWDNTLDREVAIKVLNEQFCHDERRIQAFENEARLTAQVSHPNVVKVYAVGRSYGRFYLVMELLKGQSFEQIIAKRGAIPEEEVLEIALQVASGLRAAQNAGMIHRDVKPGNIHLDTSGHARLLDFGLALITQDGRAQAEEVWATPYYVPPEALEQGIEDFRSDIYAFGASLYHALCGRPPFESTSTSNNILRRAKQTIPRLCQVAPWISPATGHVIDRMMAFRPEHRWPGYGEVLSALEQAKKSAGQKAATPIHSRHRVKRRSQSLSFGPVFGILLILLGGGLAFWQPWKQPPAPTSDSSLPPDLSDDDDEVKFNPGGEKRVELFDSWRSARQLVGGGDYREAAEAFQKLSRQPSLAGMPQVWATFEGSVASSLGGSPGRARALVARSLIDLEQILRQRSLQRRYREIAEVLQELPPPGPDDFPQDPKGITDWMGTFALALKQWDQGQWKEALPALARVRGASLPEELDWFRLYQDIADRYLADGVVLTRLDELPAPQNEPEILARLEAIAQARSDLRTKGRAPYNLQARQEYFERLLRSFREGAGWDGFREELEEMRQAGRFKELGRLLDAPPFDIPGEALWAWRFLLKNALAFTRDLSAMKGWRVVTKEGREISPVTADLGGLTMGDGTVVPWGDLPVASILEQHAGNEVHAIAFAWLVGLTEKAEERAEKLAKENEEFQGDWRRVIVGLTR